MKKFLIVLALIGLMGAAPTVPIVTGAGSENQPATTNAVTLPGNLVFSRGGMSGRFLYFEHWTATRNYQIDSIIEHSGDLWWSETDPVLADEPGVATSWTKITGQSGPGGGSSFTSGTTDPTGGADGDLYIQIDASNVIQSIWNNISGTWTEYSLPSGGADGADGATGPTGPTGPAGPAGG